MTPVSTPLELSAAGLRMMGYMIETNLRVAQVFGQAALETNPFFCKPTVSFAKPVAKSNAVSARPKTAQAQPVVKKAIPAKPAAKKALSAMPTAPVVLAAEKAAPSEKTLAPATKPAVKTTVKTTAEIATKAVVEKPTKKRTRKPSPPPALPTKSVKDD